jgi:hypothetical protein
MMFPNVEIAFSVNVHDGDQLRRRTFIFKTEIYIKKKIIIIIIIIKISFAAQ